MQTHYLKTVQPYFSEVENGTKTFEMRINDRNFQVGDEVYLQEYDLDAAKERGENIVISDIEYRIRGIEYRSHQKDRCCINVGHVKQNLSIMTRSDIAMIVHEANRAYCLQIGTDSQKPWSEAEQWQRDSILKGVDFHFENPHATPENSHESWLAEKEATGWKYGPVKDAEKKEHPCFVPYHELPVAQQAKDYLCRGIIHALKPFVTA